MAIAAGQIWKTPAYRDQKNGEILHQQHFRVEALCSRKTETGFRRIVLIRSVTKTGQNCGAVEPVFITPHTNIFELCQLVDEGPAQTTGSLVTRTKYGLVVPLGLLLITLSKRAD